MTYAKRLSNGIAINHFNLKHKYHETRHPIPNRPLEKQNITNLFWQIRLPLQSTRQRKIQWTIYSKR